MADKGHRIQAPDAAEDGESGSMNTEDVKANINRLISGVKAIFG